MAERVNSIAEALEKIHLPSLTRPSVGPNDEPTPELVRFDLCYYSYSALAYVRDLFGGLRVLKEQGNESCGEVIGRTLYEWTMQASYVYMEARTALGKNNVKSIRAVLERMEVANGWIKRHGKAYGWSSDDDVPGTVRIKHFQRAYSQYCLELLNEDTVEDDYGYLSEHAHPNSCCFLDYRRIIGSTVFFIRRLPSQQHRGIITATAIQWVLCIYEILGLAEEITVRTELGRLTTSLKEQ